MHSQGTGWKGSLSALRACQPGWGGGGGGGRPLAHSSKNLSRLATLVVKEAVPVSEAFTTLDSHG